MKPAAIAASLVDVRNIAAHKCVRLEIHVPVEQAGMAFQWKPFGLPTEHPVSVLAAVCIDLGVAQPAERSAVTEDVTGSSPVSQAKERRSWSDLSYAQQAGIRCNEPDFWLFIDEICETNPAEPSINSKEGAASFVRIYCGVESRSDLKPGTDAGRQWVMLNNMYEGSQREREYR